MAFWYNIYNYFSESVEKSYMNDRKRALSSENLITTKCNETELVEVFLCSNQIAKEGYYSTVSCTSAKTGDPLPLYRQCKNYISSKQNYAILNFAAFSVIYLTSTGLSCLAIFTALSDKLIKERVQKDTYKSSTEPSLSRIGQDQAWQLSKQNNTKTNQSRIII